jgi:DNA-binding NtrC family response regulator
VDVDTDIRLARVPIPPRAHENIVTGDIIRPVTGLSEPEPIEANIRSCDGSLPKAARVLGVSPSTLYRKRAGWIDPLPEP